MVFVLPVRKLVQADFILSQPLHSPLLMISLGIFDQIAGKTPSKLRLYTSRDEDFTFLVTWVPSRVCRVRFLHNRSGSMSFGVKLLSSPRPRPSRSLRAMDMAAASLRPAFQRFNFEAANSFCWGLDAIKFEKVRLSCTYPAHTVILHCGANRHEVNRLEIFLHPKGDGHGREHRFVV